MIQFLLGSRMPSTFQKGYCVTGLMTVLSCKFSLLVGMEWTAWDKHVFLMHLWSQFPEEGLWIWSKGGRSVMCTDSFWQFLFIGGYAFYVSIWELGEEKCPSVRKENCDWEWPRVTVLFWRKLTEERKADPILERHRPPKPSVHHRLLIVYSQITKIASLTWGPASLGNLFIPRLGRRVD